MTGWIVIPPDGCSDRLKNAAESLSKVENDTELKELKNVAKWIESEICRRCRLLAEAYFQKNKERETNHDNTPTTTNA